MTSITMADPKTIAMYRLAQKSSHHHETSLNRIKPVIEARFFINFDYKMSTMI